MDPGMISVIANSTVFALYLIIFIWCLIVTFRRRHSDTTSAFRWNITFLFLLFFTVFAMLLSELMIFVAEASDVELTVSSPAVVLSEILILAAHFLADIVILRRCYAIWNYQRKVMIAPIILLVISFGIGIYAAQSAAFAVCSMAIRGKRTFLYAFYAASLATTLLMTGLTVGRIYWLAKQGQTILGEDIGKRYFVIGFMILESGMIYSAALLAFLVTIVVGDTIGFRRRDANGETDLALRAIAQVVLMPIVTQIAGITPTLLLLRAGLMQRKQKVLPSTVSDKSRTLDDDFSVVVSNTTVTSTINNDQFSKV